MASPRRSKACAIIARAITPPGRMRRFDTRFLRRLAGSVAVELPDGGPHNELEELVWLPLDEARQADIPTITRTILDELEQRLAFDPLLRPGGPVPFYRMVRNRFIRDLPRRSMVMKHSDPTAVRHDRQRPIRRRTSRDALAADHRGDRLDQRGRHRHRPRHAAAQRHPRSARLFREHDRPEHGGRRPCLDRRRADGDAAGGTLRHGLDHGRDDHSRRIRLRRLLFRDRVLDVVSAARRCCTSR